ncbi:unnamed protein product, partial [Nesidiocoris tenuis]
MSDSEGKKSSTAPSAAAVEEFKRKKLINLARSVQRINEQGREAIQKQEAVLQFKGMFRTLEKFYTNFDSLYKELSVSIASFPDDSAKKMFASVENYYFEIHTNYEIVLSREALETNLSRVSVNASASANTSTAGNLSHLPVIQLPKFDGQLLNWPTFRDNFCAIIHNDVTIPDVKKMQYLSSCLSGPAATIISEFPCQEANYHLAWKALSQNYENKRLLASTYLNQVLQFKPLQGKASTDSLKSFLSKIVDNVSAFKNLSIENEGDFLLFHLAIRTLDAATREQFEHAHKNVAFPKFEDLAKFIRERLVAMQLSESTSSNIIPTATTSSSSFVDRGKSKPNHKSFGNKTHSLMVKSNKPSSSTQPTYPACVVCKTETHPLKRCPKFFNATVEQRHQYLTGWKGCINCLSYFHQASACESKWSCRFCSQRHNGYLHMEKGSAPTNRTSQPVNNNASCSSSNFHSAVLSSITLPISNVILGTAMAEIMDSRGNFQKIRIVVDCGSQHSFLTQSCLRRLGLPMSSFNISICGIGDTPFSGSKGQVSCKIRPCGGTNILSTNAVVVKTITTHLPTTTLPSELYQNYFQHQLADPQFWKSSSIDFLLGADLFGEIWTGQTITLEPDSPKLISSIFGNIVMGRFPSSISPDQSLSMFTTADNDLHEELQQFWKLEEPTPSTVRNPEDDICEELFQKTHYRLSSGQYVVHLPFKGVVPSLHDSIHFATKRYLNLENKFKKDPKLQSMYSEFIQEYVDLGHASLTRSPTAYAIPHHAVFKQEGDRCKIRVVFDGSAKASNGSLNDYLM